MAGLRSLRCRPRTVWPACTAWTSLVASAAMAVGCDAFAAPLDHDPDAPIKVIPTDERSPVRADPLPPPVAGGTLAVVASGTLAVASDPARDRVSVVDLEERTLRHTVRLRKGDEPGRMAQDAAGRVHVVLRGAGEIATLDVTAGRIAMRRQVCRTPRGIAYDNGVDALHVTCAEGQLVQLPAAGGNVTRKVAVPIDVRDAVLHAGRLYLSRFRSAELLSVGPDGGVVSGKTRIPEGFSEPGIHSHPHPGTKLIQVRAGSTHGPPPERRFEPNGAWRTISAGAGLVMLHQQAEASQIQLEASAADPHDPRGAATSPYGDNGQGCGGIVRTALTTFVTGVGTAPANGPVLTTSVRGSVLGVDVAADPTGRLVAVAFAGERDLAAPAPRNVFADTFGGPAHPEIVAVRGSGAPSTAVVVYDRLAVGAESMHPGLKCVRGSPMPVQGQPVAVAYTPDSRLVVQSREPATLTLLDEHNPAAAGTVTIALGGTSVADTGHDLFHRDTGQGIACAGCHLEGSDDGHVWSFSGFGRRRTQALDVGLDGTQPFHWDGALDGLDALMDEVFVGRMGGVWQSPERMEALRDWLFALEPRPAPRSQADPAVKRGAGLFASADLACATCHSGPKLTDNSSQDVGTGRPGELFQVPSLRAIAYRAPFMHNGCAQSLKQRFDKACGGGDKHGRTSRLSPAQLDDLVAYLESL